MTTEQEIDFLPPDYRLLRAQRQRSGSRRFVLVALALLISCGAYSVTARQWQLARELEQLEASLAGKDPILTEQSRLETMIEKLSNRNAVAHTLAVRMKPTRVLASITQALPESMVLRELQLAPVRHASARKSNDNRAEKELSPFERDVAELKANREQTSYVVSLEGTATDDEVLSQFLAKLEQSRLFSNVRLVFTEREELRDFSVRAFSVDLTVEAIQEFDAEAVTAVMNEEEARR
ncbi:PilN domain-containing protein [Calycomorphotria hydatis]|uniref:Fimbrial assembly protein (PilN) n=1 Tax=Calycomorphotria hydatis TaxID=2528027 RepID=A0A517TF25_9PLAN|nr:PilN domain-containing protein [Calycomorphotria hydatis]QDT66972.1 Fimbrial assembly protein (PilN) [Calycomorphotria hydatis]